MKRAPFTLALFFVVGLMSAAQRSDGDPPTSPTADSAKKDNGPKSAKEEPEFNSPPKGAVLVSHGRLIGQIAKGSDGKTFSLEVQVEGKKKEFEINLASYTKVRVTKQKEFDDKGNPKKSAPVSSAGTADDIRGGRNAVVTVSGTRDGKWLVAKFVTIADE
jgi:hypothetical protein